MAAQACSRGPLLGPHTVNPLLIHSFLPPLGKPLAGFLALWIPYQLPQRPRYRGRASHTF